jgi:hypothetical protein
MTRGHVNDLTTGLGQQMFFWGRDVLQDGNLLRKHGFEKRPSPGLQGTSCYCKAWQKGVIELHGACVGWYPCRQEDHGFLFIRADKRCFTHHEICPAVPGRYDYSKLTSGELHSLDTASRIFADWLAYYESWVLSEMGMQYRQDCFEMFGKLPSSRNWLTPALAQKWFHLYARADSQLPRAREWMKRSG